MGAICIHGHFYQPCREDPWTGEVPHQPSAAPFHDWNHRISAECYRRNGCAMVRDADGYAVDVYNNYRHISFNFGPTLLRWMERQDPQVLDMIKAGDMASVTDGLGGPALAQSYHHAILPLCSSEDLVTEITWGFQDFQRHFGRKPLGMWAPECAVDLRTLHAMATAGVAFTVVAPGQVQSFEDDHGNRQPGAPASGTLRVALADNRQITVYPYDGSVSQAVAFDGLLHNGDRLFAALQSEGFRHIATDGESYGHHHPRGEMALAWALHQLLRSGTDRVTNYQSALKDASQYRCGTLHSPSSWSCAHGVDRWLRDCGCGTNPGGGAWRAPLRRALDLVRDTLDHHLGARLADVGLDMWQLRNAYIDVINGTPFDVWADHHGIGQPVRHVVEATMAAQRHRLAMYTSCAWFFDDIDRLEPAQVLRHAWRAIQLARQVEPQCDVRMEFMTALKAIPSGHRPSLSAKDLLIEALATTRPAPPSTIESSAFPDDRYRAMAELDPSSPDSALAFLRIASPATGGEHTSEAEFTQAGFLRLLHHPKTQGDDWSTVRELANSRLRIRVRDQADERLGSDWDHWTTVARARLRSDG